jgi:hypothetical protein
MTPVDENAVQVYGAGRDQPEITPERFQEGLEAIARVYARGRMEYLRMAYSRGVDAAGRYERVSPYYEDAGADVFWFAGYDGLTFTEARVMHDAAYEQGQKGTTA